MYILCKNMIARRSRTFRLALRHQHYRFRGLLISRRIRIMVGIGVEQYEILYTSV